MRRDADWIEYELENWARWAIDRQAVAHCASVEHRYRAADWGEDCGPIRQASVPVDALRALACERAIVRLPKAPRPYAAVVISHYLRRGTIDRHVVIVRAGRIHVRMPRSSYFQALADARIMIKKLLTIGTKPDEIRYAGVKHAERIEARG